MGSRAWLAVALTLVGVLPSAVWAKAPTKIMVLDIPRDDAFRPNVIQAINEFLAGAVRDQGFDVMSSNDMVAVLGVERQKQLLGCAESSCIAELGGALGAAYLIHGTLAVLDQDSAITLTLVDSKGKSVNQVRKLVKGKSADILILAIEDLVPKLMQPIKNPAAPSSVASSAHSAGSRDGSASAGEPPAGGLVSSRDSSTASGNGTRHAVGATLLGVGAVGLAGSLVFGLLANSAQGKVNTEAAAGHYNTSNTSSLKTDALVSTIALAVGVVAAGAGGGVLLFGGSDDAAATP